MENGLRTYITNKITSLSLVALVIGVSLWVFGYVETQWQFVMIVLIAFGYSHFIIGAIYQLKSFLKKDKPWQYFVTFAALTIFSIVVVSIFFALNKFLTILFFLLYFLVHGLLNEQTLLFRQSGIRMPSLYAWSFFLIILAILLYAMPDHTFLMNRNLSFAPVNDFLLTVSLNGFGLKQEFFTFFFWASVFSSFVLLVVAWIKSKKHILSMSFGLVLAGLVLITYFFGAIPYVYMLFIVVGYHFVTWFLFYFTSFRQRGDKEFSKYLTIHAVFFLPFAVGGFYFLNGNPPSWSYFIFDYFYFTYATYIHISTSFMNEGWFQNLQTQVFEKFQKTL